MSKENEQPSCERAQKLQLALNALREKLVASESRVKELEAEAVLRQRDLDKAMARYKLYAVTLYNIAACVGMRFDTLAGGAGVCVAVESMKARLDSIKESTKSVPEAPKEYACNGEYDWALQLKSYADFLRSLVGVLKFGMESQAATIEKLREENEAVKLANKDNVTWFEDARAEAEGLRTQLEELKRSLANAQKENEKLLMLHQPLWKSTTVWSSKKADDGSPAYGASIPNWVITELEARGAAFERERLGKSVMVEHRDGYYDSYVVFEGMRICRYDHIETAEVVAERLRAALKPRVSLKEEENHA